MQQSNSVTKFERGNYRAYFKGRYRLVYEPYAQAKILTYNINVDLMAKATSTFTFSAVPTAVQHGDVIIVADPYGNIFYKGVINEITSNSLTCFEIEYLFDDPVKRTNVEDKERYPLDFVFSKTLGAFSMYEENTKFYINKGRNDGKSAQFWGQFTILTQWALQPMITFGEANKEVKFADMLRDVFIKYNGTFYIDIPIGRSNNGIYIYIKSPNYDDVISMTNNSVYTPTFVYTTETAENNKLVITKINAQGVSVFHRAYYLTADGITSDPNVPRDNEIKTTYAEIEDGQTEEELIRSNLNDVLFNHKINIDLVLYNDVYDFFNYKLGQSFNIFVNNKYFRSIFTAYNIDSTKGGIVTLTFGKVRTKYSQKKEFYK